MLKFVCIHSYCLHTLLLSAYTLIVCARVTIRWKFSACTPVVCARVAPYENIPVWTFSCSGVAHCSHLCVHSHLLPCSSLLKSSSLYICWCPNSTMLTSIRVHTCLCPSSCFFYPCSNPILCWNLSVCTIGCARVAPSWSLFAQLVLPEKPHLKVCLHTWFCQRSPCSNMLTQLFAAD